MERIPYRGRTIAKTAGDNTMNTLSDHKVPNLERGLSVIELLSEHPEGMIGSEIAALLEIPRNSAGRILAALTDRGFLEKDEKSNNFYLSQRLVYLGRSVISDRSLIEESLDEMRALRDQLGETVMLSCCNSNDGVILEQVAALHQVRLSVDPGTRFQLHCSAPGKLYLANLNLDKLAAVLKPLPMARMTDNTITTVSALREELAMIRDQGYAADREEGLKGICCVSTSVHNRNGLHVAELTVTGMSTSITDARLDELAFVVKKYASNISRRLGMA